MTPEVSVGSVGLTQGSAAITLAGAFTFVAAYVTDRWALHINGEGNKIFRLKSIDDSPTNQAATLEDFQQWTQSSGSQSGVFTKDIYALPNDADKILRVQCRETYTTLAGMRPQEFDHQRTILSTERGSEPRFYCLRQNHLEVWPAPGDSTYWTLDLTYRRGIPTVFATTGLDADTVDWPDAKRDLLEAAILLEASFYQTDPPISLEKAASKYAMTLEYHLNQDNSKQDMSGPMSLGGALARNPLDLQNYAGPLTETT